MSLHQYVYSGLCFFTYTGSLTSADYFRWYNRLMYSTPSPPCPIDGPSKSRATHHLDTSDVLHMDNASSCEKCASYAPCLQLLLIVWAGPVTVDALPDDVLLHIFHLDRVIHLDELDALDRHSSWRWDRLGHVCQRWRSIIFASPNFLDLKVVLRPWSHREPPGIWSTLPISIMNGAHEGFPEDCTFDAVTVHRNRVREIHLHSLGHSQILRLASAMQGQFPALIHLSLACVHFNLVPGLPDGFLDGHAPLLQSLKLRYFRFPALPNFLLSATHLVQLTFEEFRHSGYISPEEILTCLAVLAKLKSLILGFQIFPSHHQESRHSPPPTCIVLPVLTHFEFYGDSGYLEDLVARIDAPLLDSIQTNLEIQPTSDFSQLARFMRRSTWFQPPNEVHVDFRHSGMHVRSFPPRYFDEGFRLKIACARDWHTSRLVQVFALSLPSIHMVDHLYIYPSRHSSPVYQGYKRFFHFLTGVKNFYISEELTECMAFELKDLARERVANVLPALECIFLENLQPSKTDQERYRQFAAARQLLGRPVTISTWNKTGDHFVFKTTVQSVMTS